MSEIKKLTKTINKWVSDRNWDKFQKPKDLAISICLEASELLEHFQWKSEKQFSKHVKENKEDVADELADVAIYTFKLADKLNIDLAKAIINKLDKTSKKFPIDTVRSDSDLSKYYKIKKRFRAQKN